MSWVKAFDVKPLDFELRLAFSVNTRSKSLQDVTHLVRDARLGISEEYIRSTIDHVAVDRPKKLEFGGKRIKQGLGRNIRFLARYKRVYPDKAGSDRIKPVLGLIKPVFAG
ncbi:HXXXD-type acyl-transferase family protein [Artemisia annua]|uniref:HXXXD-type acyl-transferase family protein n=1 Tax=Artemisia annua TaxID=35608 RepID=A0A2U1KEK9_ARTAN|nr:HXXXD-type acyl-transferase family protein [Artemisia annua]